MTVTVSATGKRNSHHIKLTKGTDIVGLNLCGGDGSLNERAYQRDPMMSSAIKMYSGEEQYSDHAPPWRDVAQKDWSAGRGLEAFDDDPTRYLDDHRMNTTLAGEISLWGLESWSKGIIDRSVVGRGWYGFGTVDDGSAAIYSPVPTNVSCLQAFVATANYNARHIYFYAKKVGAPISLTVTLYNSAMNVLKTATMAATELEYKNCFYLRRATITAQALTSGSTYYVGFASDFMDANNYYMIGASDASSNEPGIYPIYVCITAEDAPARMHQANLRGLDYVGVEYLNGTVSKVYRNGTAGWATSATSTTLVDTNNADLTDDRFNRWIVVIVAGKGSEAVQPWRKITDVVSATKTITVDTAWEITPDTTSEYVIIGGNEWLEVTGHGLGAGEQIKCALSVCGALYFGCGDSVDMVRLRRYWSGATYHQWADDTNNKATLLKKLTRGGQVQVWRATRGRPAQISMATALDCTGTGAVGALAFGTAINVGDVSERINGLAVAGDDFPRLHVLKEGSIHEIMNDVAYELRVSEFDTVRDPINGIASCVKGSYLYFNHGDGVERMYRTTVESIGPNLDAGLPSDRTGYVCGMVNYKGFLIMLVDGGAYNYSSVLVYNGMGYCEMWRSPAVGMRILNAWVSPMPGNNVDRLWVNCNGNLLWLPLNINLAKVNQTYQVQTDIQYYSVNYPPGGHMVTGWFYLSLRLLDKLFNAIRIIKEGGGWSILGLLYQLEADTADWVVVSDAFGSFDEDCALASSDLTGKRIRFLLTYSTTYGSIATKIMAMVLEALAVSGDYEYRDSFTVRIADNDLQLDGRTPDDLTAAQKLALLKSWIESAGTVTVNMFDPLIDGKRLKLDSMPVRIIHHYQDDLRNEYVVQFSGYEVG